MKQKTPPEWHRLFSAALNDELSDADRAQLAAVLKSSAEARQLWFLYQDNECSLAELKPRPQAKPARGLFSWLSRRPLTSAAAGIVLGMLCTSLVWAISSPRTTTERLFLLSNGGFDEAGIGQGFPRQIGGWSGDEAAIVDGSLRFIRPESDSSDPTGRAIACDVFQLVDLRSIRRPRPAEGDEVLELSVRFADERPYNTNPSVTFFCQLYLFQGEPSQMHQNWPKSIPDALASGSAQVTTLGTDAKGSRQLTARCLVPAEADFAVVQIAARPNLRPAKLDGLIADDVTLTLKTSPELPIRTVQR
ncbi:MAG: hypothetical protein RL088_4265 [Verrucomicrobiota bacterium]|jgi:hypothetical protein